MPMSIAVDQSNTLNISDFGNHRVWQCLSGTANGTIVAGRSDGTSGSGVSDLNGPFGIVVDRDSGVYIADAWNNRIVYWSNGSSSGTIVAGTGKKDPV